MSKRIYLFGAGASHNLKFNINTIDGGLNTFKQDALSCLGPLSSGFFYHTEQLVQQIKQKVSLCSGLSVDDALLNYATEYCRNKYKKSILKTQILNNKTLSIMVNIEDLFITLEKEIEILSSRHKDSLNTHEKFDAELYNKALTKLRLEEYIFNALSFISNYCYSLNHSRFANYLIKYGGHVISFNWDILLDEAMYYTHHWDYGTGYGITFEEIIDKSGNYKPLSQKTKNLILKPHGSINWYHQKDDEGTMLLVPEDRDMRGGTLEKLNFREVTKSGVSIRSYLVPPGRKRKAFPLIWARTKEVLEEAEEIIAIGFAFNDKDKHVQDEFRDLNLRPNLKLRLVDPNSDSLLKIYGEIFKTNNINVISDSFEHFCDALPLS